MITLLIEALVDAYSRLSISLCRRMVGQSHQEFAVRANRGDSVATNFSLGLNKAATLHVRCGTLSEGGMVRLIPS